MALSSNLVSPDPHGQGLCGHGLWKNRIKYGENVSRAN
jgi:hypothetical protein